MGQLGRPGCALLGDRAQRTDAQVGAGLRADNFSWCSCTAATPAWLLAHPGKPHGGPCTAGRAGQPRASLRTFPRPCSILHRRIALGSHVSLALTLDSGHPGALPTDCRFMGSDAAVAPLRWVGRAARGCVPPRPADAGYRLRCGSYARPLNVLLANLIYSLQAPKQLPYALDVCLRQVHWLVP